MKSAPHIKLSTAITAALLLSYGSATRAFEAPSANAYGVPRAMASSGDAYLFGNWNGARTRLSERGVDFHLGLINDTASNLSGGDRHVIRSAGQLTLSSTADLDTLFGWDNTVFRVSISNRHGREVGADAGLGNSQLVQGIYGLGQTWWLSQFWLRKSWLDDRLAITFGRTQVNADFGRLDCSFQNLTFCGPQATNTGMEGWIGWPAGVWGAHARLQATSDVYVKLGAYQNNPTYLQPGYGAHHGLELDNPSGTTGALLPLELGWTPHPSGLPGEYKFGAWYNTGGGDDLVYNRDGLPLALAGGQPRHHGATYGGYLSFKQQISGTAGGRGYTLLFNHTQTNQATAILDRQVSLGIERKGIGRRDSDGFGVSIGGTHTSSRYAQHARAYNSVNPDSPIAGGGSFERVAEAYYAWAPTASTTVRPNIQYISNPGGSHEHESAWIVGMKTILAF